MSYPLCVLLIMLAFVDGTFASLTSNDFNLLSMVKKLQEKSQTHESIIQSLQSQTAKQNDQIMKLLAHEKQQNERTSKLKDLVYTLLEQERQQNERITKQDNLIHTLLEQEKQQNERIMKQDDLINSLLKQGKQQNERIMKQDDLINSLLKQGKQQNERIIKQDEQINSLLEQGTQQNERIAKQENLISILKEESQQLHGHAQNRNGLIRMDSEQKELDDMLWDFGSGKPTNGSSEPHFTPQGKMTPRKFKKDVWQTSATVAFQANVRSNDVTHIGLHQKIIFDDVIMNIGNAYHSQHGLFIAPRQGLYIFSASILSYDGHKSIECGIMKNGLFLGGAISNVHTNRAQGSATVVIHLKVGDEVWVENIFPADTSVHRDYTAFMGCFISDN